MGMSQSSKCVLWAAQDGRLNDLIYHLQGAGPEALEPSGWSEKHQAPIHLAAIRGHTKCIRVLREAGKCRIESRAWLGSIHGDFINMARAGGDSNA